MPTTTLSSRSQIILPAEVRRRLGIRPGDRLVVEVEDDHAVIRLADTLSELEALRDKVDSLQRRIRRASRIAVISSFVCLALGSILYAGMPEEARSIARAITESCVIIFLVLAGLVRSRPEVLACIASSWCAILLGVFFFWPLDSKGLLVLLGSILFVFTTVGVWLEDWMDTTERAIDRYSYDLAQLSERIDTFPGKWSA